MRIFIIRHGEPDYSTDSLTAKGKIEAGLLARRMAGEHLTAIYCSPLGRAVATARPTAEATGMEPVVLDWLREVPAGVCPGGADREACPWTLSPDYWPDIPRVHDRDGWRNAEPFCSSRVPALYDDVCAAFDALTASHGYRRTGQCYAFAPGRRNDADTIALFCHMGLGLAIISHVLSVSLPLVWNTVFLPASSVTTLYMEKRIPDRNIAVARLTGLGDVSHLYAAGEPVSSSGLVV
jgi:broad specificity phosphatase PhoE